MKVVLEIVYGLKEGRVSRGCRFPRERPTAEIEHAGPVEFRSVVRRSLGNPELRLFEMPRFTGKHSKVKTTMPEPRKLYLDGEYGVGPCVGIERSDGFYASYSKCVFHLKV